MKPIYILTTFLVFSIIGCRDFVEIDPPKGRPVPDAVYSNPETANSALLTIIGNMGAINNISTYWISLLTGISGDELTNGSSLASDIYVNAIDPRNNTYPNAFWTAAYNMIYQANSVYEGCDQSTALPINLKTQLMAEAAFIRAYWHFYLVNLYGDIPVITTTDYSVNSKAARQPIAKVYEQIIADIKYAQTNLNENYVGPNGLTAADLRVRPNKAAATAMLARVYLYTHNYMEAEAQATALIQNSTYKIEEIDKVFLKESKEAIWQIMPRNNSNFNTHEGNQFIPTDIPSNQNKAVISDQLLNSFENGDLRKEEWIGIFTDEEAVPAKDYYFPYKYKIRSGSDYTEYSVVFRLAEQYLIRSEARAQLNKLADAIKDIDVVRYRAGLPLINETNPDIGKDELLMVILKERQAELFAEQGHRWFDLKRTGQIEKVMSEVTPLKGPNIWNTNKKLWPIPQTEILNDPNLTQNPGYN